MLDTLFIQFAREPVPGEVKTRLLPALSPREACQIHIDLLRHTSRVLVGAGLGEVQLAVAGDTAHPVFRDCLADGVATVVPQAGEDLGSRMLAALRAGLATHRRVVLVGSDCPQLDAHYLAGALAALARHDVVLGPALDGGYVLIGVRRVESGWFDGVDWGTHAVYRQTAARLDASGARWLALAALADVDRPEDLPHWRSVRRNQLPGGA